MYILKNLWFQTLMRQFFFNIDKIVFNLISKVYDLLVVIARTSPLSQGDITQMANRIYRLLAIFMVFKVTFSLIMYVVNPDDFTEKSKGVGSLTKNVILSLAMLILTPYIFRYAYQLQEIILEDNSLAVLVLGDQGISNNFFSSAGDKMAFVAMQPFFVPDTSIKQLDDCTSLLVDAYEDGRLVRKFNPKCSGLDENYEGITTSEDNTSGGSLYSLTTDNNSDLKLTDLQNYVVGIEQGVFGLAFRQDIAVSTVTKDGPYIMDYSYLMSTAVGIVILLLLISYCMDIAIRSIKLGFLQLIAPIPIISYVDPKSGKDGMFKKWYKMCLSTFASLFIRLLVMYFVVYLVSIIGDGKLVDVVDGSYVKSFWVSLFILIGALMFAKQFPKILENLGIKLDGAGKFTLNPLKKIENEALGGKQIHNLARGARGFAAGAAIGVAGFATGAGFGRALSGAFSGAQAGLKGKKVGEIRKDQVQRNAVMRRAIAGGSTFKERMGTRFSSFLGTPGRLGNFEHDKMDVQNKLNNVNSEKGKINEQMAEHKRVQGLKRNTSSAADAIKSRAEAKLEEGTTKASQAYLNKKHAYENLKNNGTTDYRKATASELAAAQQKLFEARNGKVVTRAATAEEINRAKVELDNLKAGKSAGGIQLSNIDPREVQRAQQRYDDLISKGVEYNQGPASEAEIAEAQQAYDDLTTKGVEYHRAAKEEDLTQALKEMNEQKKQSTYDYISGVINGEEGYSDATLKDTLFEDFVSQGILSGDLSRDENGNVRIVTRDENGNEQYSDLITAGIGKEIDDLGGRAKSEVARIQRDEISAREAELQKKSDEAAALEREQRELNSKIEDAKSSLEVVKGTDPGPANAKTLHRSDEVEGYREGGRGSGVPPAATGYVPGRGPRNNDQ